jgi:putative glutathione S-transferase
MITTRREKIGIHVPCLTFFVRYGIKLTEEGSKFPPENDRYHLFVAYACPWAHRTLITRAVKGLEDVMSVTIVMPVWKKTKPDDLKDGHNGWIFANPGGEDHPNTSGLGGPFPASYPENDPEPFYESATVRELYERAGDTSGKYSVPILWDKKLNTIVSNE